MTESAALPDYDRLFGELDVLDSDEYRTVYSPAAYLADLLHLLHDSALDRGLLERRPDIADVPLDASATTVEQPYLDVVNRVLARDLESDPAVVDAEQHLRTLDRALPLPFSLSHARLGAHLERLDLDPVELYTLFVDAPDADLVARLHLGLSAEDIAVLTARATASGVCAFFGVDALSDLAPARFRAVLGLSEAELAELLHGRSGRPTLATALADLGDGRRVTVTSDGRFDAGGVGPETAWFARAVHVVRLARRTALAPAAVDVVLRTCGATTMDEATLRVLAATVALHRRTGLSLDVVASLVAPMDTLGVDGSGTAACLFDQVFNAVPGRPVLGPLPGDVTVTAEDFSATTPPARALRARLARDLGWSEADLEGVVGWVRDRGVGGKGPFDRDDIVADLSLLHRLAGLAVALRRPVAEVLTLLDLVADDPGARAGTPRWLPLAVPSPPPELVVALDAAGDVRAGLCLVARLVEIDTHLRSTVASLADVAQVAGRRDPVDDGGLLDGVGFAGLDVGMPFASERFDGRSARVIVDRLTGGRDEPPSGRPGEDPVAVDAAARAALEHLGTVGAADLVGLGLGSRLAARMWAHLVRAEVLAGDGRILATPDSLPRPADFDERREEVFAAVRARCAVEEPDGGTAALRVADLVGSGSPDEARELFENLVACGHLDDDGTIRDPEFFGDDVNASALTVTVDLHDLEPAVTALLGHRRDTSPKDVPRVLQPDDLRAPAEAAVAARVLADLEGCWLVDGRMREEVVASFAAGTPALPTTVPGTTSFERALVARRIRAIVGAEAPYRVTPDRLVPLGVDTACADALVTHLQAAGVLTSRCHVAPGGLDPTAVSAAVGAADPGGHPPQVADVLALLQDVADESATAVAEIRSAWHARGDHRLAVLHQALGEALRLPESTTEAVCLAVAGSPGAVVDEILEPLALVASGRGLDALTETPLRTHLGRIRRLAHLAVVLDLDAPRVPFAAARALPDHRLTDIVALARFARLDRAGSGDPRDLPTTLDADPTATDVDEELGFLLGREPAEVRWVRHEGPLAHEPGRPLAVEDVLALDDLLTFADRLDSTPSWLRREVWEPLFADHDADAAARSLATLLARSRDAGRWEAMASAIHDEVNARRRDALVAAMLTRRCEGDPSTSRGLFERFLIDVDMGAHARTTAVREAIAATQLYVHRFLFGLEEDPTAGDRERTRSAVARWWTWMRSYRVWEANRKVFLHPENYLRPELRATTTSAFRDLESELLQGEVTLDSVERAYRRYLDAYTELSRLTIAGGYGYRPDGAVGTSRSLVLFGRTRTAPRRYHYRFVDFADRGASATWGPWTSVDVAITADEVSPTYAFGRVFVFWAALAPVPPTEADVDGPAPDAGALTARHRVVVSYSFYNLTRDWVPAQELGTLELPDRVVLDDSRITLSVRAPAPSGVSVARPGPIHVTVAYRCERVPADALLDLPPLPRSVDRGYLLHPELFAVETSAAPGEQSVEHLLDELLPGAPGEADRPTGSRRAVRLGQDDSVGGSPWLGIDHQGASFLVRPAVDPPPVTVNRWPGVPIPLPAGWVPDAGVELRDGTRIVFAGDHFVEVPAGAPAAPTATRISERWGRAGRTVPEDTEITGVLVRRDVVLVVHGTHYRRYEGDTFETDLRGPLLPVISNTDGLPRWNGIDAAFRASDGREWFYSVELGGLVVSGALDRPVVSMHHPGYEPRQRLPVFTGVVLGDGLTYVFGHPLVYRCLHADLPTSGLDLAHDLRSAVVTASRVDEPVRAAFTRHGVSYVLTGARWFRVELGAGTTVHCTAVGAPDYTGLDGVDAAWIRDDTLHLVRGEVVHRHALDRDGRPGPLAAGVSRTPPGGITASFVDGDELHLVLPGDPATGDGDNHRVAVLGRGQTPGTATGALATAGHWDDLPRDARSRLTGVLDLAGVVYFLFPEGWVAREKGPQGPMRPVRVDRAVFRLSSGTAADLNRRLLAGGIDALLSPTAQQIDEVPRFTTERDDDPGSIVLSVEPEALPPSTHLDFQNANGIHYWEIFFHAPLLIAQALRGAQRFDEARRWHEFIFDPTERTGYWRFLPFLIADVEAFARRLGECATESCRAGVIPVGSRDRALGIGTSLSTVAPTFRAPGATPAEVVVETLRTAANDARALLVELTAGVGVLSPGLEDGRLGELGELLGIVPELAAQYHALGDRGRLLVAYREDPLDPHAIAALRPVAYRRAVVMSYVDTLLDWGDTLFRRHTAESVDEARMLYVFAQGLLGSRPEALGTRLLPSARSYEEAARDRVDLLGPFLTGDGALVEGPGSIHRSVGEGYFTIPANDAFDAYWDRVDDRLRKIRASLDIEGVAVAVPWFDAPLDPMQAVRAAAAGRAGSGTGLVAGPRTVPHQRFTTVLATAQVLADRVRSLGADLLVALEKGDAEALAELTARQESTVLGATRSARRAQVDAARAGVEEMAEALRAVVALEATLREHESAGISARQREQLALMATASAASFAAAPLKVAAAIVTPAPKIQISVTPGTETGGDQWGEALNLAAEVSQSISEGFSLAGEIMGLREEHDRIRRELRMQIAAAESDRKQVAHRHSAAEQQLAQAEHEAALAEIEIVHRQETTAFLADRFSTRELYRWTSGRLGELYFATYQLALDTARAAEAAFCFERGVPERDVSFVRATAWDRGRRGLLAGEALVTDLDRMSAAWADGAERALEITRRVSLRETDAFALLDLTSTGSCTFALTEALFDRDFPGHHRRRLASVAVDFLDAAGETVTAPATLTQLSHKTVLAPDPEAVSFLLAPTGSPPSSIRSDWRAVQQVALSDVRDPGQNHGVFDLRYDDERYLPFEGTGAVSTWRLRAGRVATLAAVKDVVLTVRYRAVDGGEAFAAAVRALQRPSTAASLLELATDFPEQWRDFTTAEDGQDLVLPMSSARLPGLEHGEVTGIYPVYLLDPPDAPTQLALAGVPAVALPPGRVTPTPGLSADRDWTFTVVGRRADLLDVGLVMTYTTAGG